MFRYLKNVSFYIGKNFDHNDILKLFLEMKFNKRENIILLYVLGMTCPIKR
jgi:hypothetical protein